MLGKQGSEIKLCHVSVRNLILPLADLTVSSLLTVCRMSNCIFVIRFTALIRWFVNAVAACDWLITEPRVLGPSLVLLRI